MIIALNVWPKYMRAKIVNGVDNSITFLAQAFLLVSDLVVQHQPIMLHSRDPFHPGHGQGVYQGVRGHAL